jgi:hypothetical protein
MALTNFPLAGFGIGLALTPLVHHLPRPLGGIVYGAAGALIAFGPLLVGTGWPSLGDVGFFAPPMAGILVYGVALLVTRHAPAPVLTGKAKARA